jgi:hypothetical protein
VVVAEEHLIHKLLLEKEQTVLLEVVVQGVLEVTMVEQLFLVSLEILEELVYQQAQMHHQVEVVEQELLEAVELHQKVVTVV